MSKAHVNQFNHIFHEEILSGDFFVHALNASQNLICMVKLATDVENHKTMMQIYHFNNAFEQVVGPYTKIKGQDLRLYLNVENLFSDTEWISADNIRGEKVHGQLRSHWNEFFDVHVSWNLFEVQSQAYLCFVFDHFQLPERLSNPKASGIEIPAHFKELQYFSFRRLASNIRSQFLYNYPEAPELQIKFDSSLTDQVAGPESALYTSLNAIFDIFTKAQIKNPIRMTFSTHPDKPRVARILVRTHGHLTDFYDMDYYQQIFQSLGGSFIAETHEDSDSSVYISFSFDPVAGEIPASPAPEERLPKMVPVGLKTFFIQENQTNKLIMEHFLEGLHIQTRFHTIDQNFSSELEQYKPDLIFIEVSPTTLEEALSQIEKIRSFESTYTANRCAIVAIIPEDRNELRGKLIEAGCNACMMDNYTRKNLLEAMIHFAPTLF